MPTPPLPPVLRPGATIAFISPSARLNHKLPDVISRATSVFTKRGYKVRIFFNEDDGIQSSITNRLEEIRAAFSDPGISAIISTIGGTSLTELLPSLIADTELHAIIQQRPKIFVGYSDNSAFHYFLHALTGLRTFYGPGAIPELGDTYSNGPSDDASPLQFCIRHLLRAIESRDPLREVPRSSFYAPKLPEFFRDSSSTKPLDLAPSPQWTWLRHGTGRGRLFGGCLTVVARLHGIKAIVPNWEGRIVFLETASSDDLESGNPPDRVRAGFADLIAQGVFDDVAGLVVGRPFGYNSPNAQKLYTGIITSLLCEGRLAAKTFPILFNVDFGHTTPMITLPYDAMAELDSEKDSFCILESGVA